MKLSRTSIVVCLSATLTACAGGGGSPVSEPPGGPLQTPRHAGQAHIVEIDGASHVGADVAAPRDALSLVARHGNVDVSHGSVRDGVGAAELAAYLEADVASFTSPDGEGGTDTRLVPEGLLLRFAAAPPIVRVAAGTPAGLLDETVRAIQAINAALPRDWRLGFGRDPAPSGAPEPPDGEILVTFAPQEDWPPEVVAPDGEDVGLAEPRYAIVPTGDPQAPFSIEIVAGRIWVDPSQTSGRERLGVIAHELIHVLGRGHVDAGRFSETLMVAGGAVESSGHVLHPLDREALLAVYGRLDSGALAESVAETFGPWSDTSMHVRGVLATEGGEIGFGAALRNGLSQPWAMGSTPSSSLEDNTELSGTARWTGRLLGLTPHAETVAGAVDLTVDVATLSGAAEFSALEYWPADAAPGAVGGGNAWHDGDLSYGIEVRGNRFTQTGGDAGEVTGTFFGPSHEGMGGVLVRDDLSAGFGGVR